MNKSPFYPKKILLKCLKLYENNFIWALFWKTVIRIYNSVRSVLKFLIFLYRKSTRSFRTFTFNGKKYNHIVSPYNETWLTERGVEVPIILGIVNEYGDKNVLEIGNVLAHYKKFKHDVIDKYEIATGVSNEDIVDFRPAKKYDLIISISTLEHVGFDEPEKDPLKTLKTVEHAKSLLNKNGIMAFTFPIGHNPGLDELVRSKKLDFTEKYYLKLVSNNNVWVQAEWEDVKDSKINGAFAGTNALVVGIMRS